MIGYKYQGLFWCQTCGNMERDRLKELGQAPTKDDPPPHQSHWPIICDFNKVISDRPEYCENGVYCQRRSFMQVNDAGDTVRYGAWLGNKLTGEGLRFVSQDPTSILSYLQLFWYANALKE